MSGAALGRYPSPLRYPGGKGKIANYIKLLMLENDLVGSDYVEPYAGGASVALSLLFEDYADHVHINDLNAGVHAFWHSVLHDTDNLCALIERTPVTIGEWRKQQTIRAEASTTTLELGFATFFLNRTNRSGIISGGVIGGLEQRGPYKIDARYNTTELLRRIRKVARYRTRITVSQQDALAFLQPWTDDSRRSALVYLDPPYFVKGEGLYDNFYGPEDHAEVSRVVSALTHPWIVSYDSAPEILKLYPEADSIRYALSYSASSASVGTEAMFFSPGLEQPAGADTPARVSSRAVAAAMTGTN